ncbi:FAD:protein FMN transferase [Paenibacillus sp. SI8]|uniref:FAD:protein FMN transferase n=1 Tax=unclassified Paenibacillus TaxID=185978 RepID=UPI0034656B7A
MEPIAPSFHPFHFQALQSNIELLLRCEDKDVPIIEKVTMDWFRSVEKRFSRLHDNSEISLLNTLAGENCMISNTMLEVLFLAEAYQTATNGNYIPLQQDGAVNAPSAPPSLLAWKVDPVIKSIRLPDHTSIDLRGIDKSWSVKRLAESMQSKLELSQGLIIAGGDMTVWGRSSSELDPYVVGIQNPWNLSTKIGAIALSEGSLSTWNRLEEGAYAEGSDVMQCTVAGQDIVECQVWAKTLCSLGIEEGLALLAERTARCEAVVLSTAHKLHYCGRRESLGRRWIDMNIDHYHFQQDKVS